jgi:phage terminase large subunit GpA-like protein
MDLRLRAALRAARAILRPPPNVSVIEWADKYRFVAAKTSATPGKWRTSVQPAAYGPMAAVFESDTHTVSIMAGTQIIKSETLLNVCGYFIQVDPSAILFVQPTQGAAESFAKERFAPMVAATPELAKLVAMPRARDSENTISHKTFPGGSLDFVGANSPVDLSSRPKRIILCDEIDKFPPSAGSEGDPPKLAEERASTYRNIGRAKSVRTCSPTDKETSRIAREYRFSDRRKCFVACPHCGHEQTLAWAQVSWNKGPGGEDLPDTARILCSACGTFWSETERKEAVRALERAPGYGWRQTKDFTCCGAAQTPQTWDGAGRSLCSECGNPAPYAGHAGFHISKLYSLRHRLSDVVAEFLESRDDFELQRKWTNTALAETWEHPLGEGIDGNALLARRELYGPDDLPAAIKVITAFCDVQGDRLEVQFAGFGGGDECWTIQYVILNLDPAQGRAWRELDATLARTFHRRDGQILRCGAAGIDAGGHHGSQVYDFVRRHRGRRIFATYGRGGKRPLWTGRAGKTKAHDEFHLIGVDAAKDAIYSRLKIEPAADGAPTPGCIHFPADPMFESEYFAQLCSERREVRRRADGQYYSLYVLPSGKRNEALDTLVGNLAVRRSLPGRVERSLEYSIAGRETWMTPTGLRAAPVPAEVAKVRPVAAGPKIFGPSSKEPVRKTITSELAR